MNFDYQLQTIETPSLSLKYFKVPWDTEIVGRPVAEISSLSIRNRSLAMNDFSCFEIWRRNEKVFLCSCRIDQEKSEEIFFLQEANFRFIELHYTPELRDLQSRNFEAEDILVAEAPLGDREQLAEIAGKIFEHGRFHQDIRLGRRLGNDRYRKWMLNSFDRPTQKVLKCLLDGQIVAFFVVEYPFPNHCHWSLVGMAPDFSGRGLAKRAWQSVLRWHQEEGIHLISTGISSHNIRVFNLYAALEFRFPAPKATFHWMPSGASLE